MKLTGSQWRLLAAVKRLSKRGFSPSVRELGAELGITSTNAITEQLDRLVKVGALTRVERQPRSIVVTKAGHAALQENA